MNKESCAILFGKDKDTEFRFLDREEKLTVFAMRSEKIVDSIRIGSKIYFYSLFGKRILESFTDLADVDLNEVEGPWQENIFIGENGLVMLFCKEQFLLKISDKVQDNILAYLQKTYKGQRELILNG